MCRHMGWSVGEYDATPLAVLRDIEYAIAAERRHAQAEHDAER